MMDYHTFTACFGKEPCYQELQEARIAEAKERLRIIYEDISRPMWKQLLFPLSY